MLTRPLGIFSLPYLNVFVSSVQRHVQDRMLWQPSRSVPMKKKKAEKKIKLPRSKNSLFPNKAKCKTFLLKMSFICMRIKNHFHFKGFALSLALKQRFRAKSVKYDKISCYEVLLRQCSRSILDISVCLAIAQLSYFNSCYNISFRLFAEIVLWNKLFFQYRTSVNIWSLKAKLMCIKPVREMIKTVR